MTSQLPFSQAAENNREPIGRILKDVFRAPGAVLEIGSLTGQHAVHMGAQLPHIDWQPSDVAPSLDGLSARIRAEATENVRAPIELDVSARPWPVDQVDGVFSANVVHIISIPLIEEMFSGIGSVLKPGGNLCLYGPFKYDGRFTTESNARFDQWLKDRDPESGIRDFEYINKLAGAQGLNLIEDHAMPANNQLIVWRHVK